MDLDNHDVWLDLESHEMCYIARSTTRSKSVSCTPLGAWLFCNVWTNKLDAINHLNTNGEGPDDYELQHVACAELFSMYRAVNYNSKLMLLSGITSGIQISTTYVPTQRLVTDPTNVWLYAKYKDEIVTQDDAVIVALTPVLLMAELNLYSNSFDNDFAEGFYTLHCSPFMQLVKQFTHVHTDETTFNLRHEMGWSKIMHDTLVQKERSNDV
jgi:hypothetical protein